MGNLKKYIKSHIQDVLILSILATVVAVNYFIQAKMAFLDIFYLLVVLAGYYIGKRFAVLGAFFAILMVWVFILANKSQYYSTSASGEVHINLTVWGGFLVLAAWLIGSLSEKLRRELEETQQLRDDLHHERELLSISNRQLRDYSMQLEERVTERTQELQQSNQELMDFAFTASHDLQEPLRKISMFGDRLEELIPKEDSKSRDYLDRMRKSARRMQGFIEDLLKLSGVGLGARPFQSVNLQQVAGEVVEDLEVRIVQSKGKVTVEKLPTLEADAVQMRQLLQNLIGNALKYHREGDAPVVEVTGRPLRDGMWEIMVRDQGIGIDGHQVGKIFQPFQRANSGALFEGNGIGLAICKKIVDRHGGTIRVISALNQGTSLFITLPENKMKSDEKTHPNELTAV